MLNCWQSRLYCRIRAARQSQFRWGKMRHTTACFRTQNFWAYLWRMIWSGIEAYACGSEHVEVMHTCRKKWMLVDTCSKQRMLAKHSKLMPQRRSCKSFFQWDMTQPLMCIFQILWLHWQLFSSIWWAASQKLQQLRCNLGRLLHLQATLLCLIYKALYCAMQAKLVPLSFHMITQSMCVHAVSSHPQLLICSNM